MKTLLIIFNAISFVTACFVFFAGVVLADMYGDLAGFGVFGLGILLILTIILNIIKLSKL